MIFSSILVFRGFEYRIKDSTTFCLNDEVRRLDRCSDGGCIARAVPGLGKQRRGFGEMGNSKYGSMLMRMAFVGWILVERYTVPLEEKKARLVVRKV